MGTEGKRAEIEALLTHQRFLRQFVQGLLADEHEVEDVVQATWLSALRRPPLERSSLRGWLARVARNLSVSGMRRERATVEGAGEPAGTPSTPDEIASQVELQRKVLAELLALPLALRSALHARYFEDLPPAEIARRTGVPLDTVKDRLRRGKAILRQRLRSELGSEERERGRWLVLAMRLLRPVAGGLIVKKAVALVALITLITLTLWWLRQERGAPVRPGAGLAAAPAPLEPSPASTMLALPEPASAARAHAATPAADEPSPASATGSLAVTVTWMSGQPAPSVAARVWSEDEWDPPRFYRTGVSGADGSFRMEGLAPGRWWIQLDRGAERVPVEMRSGEETAVVLQVPSGPRVEGIVVDRDGNPVGRAGIWLARREPSQYSGYRHIDDVLAARTGLDGRFEIPSTGAARYIGARAQGYAPSAAKSFEGRPSAVTEMRLVLPSPGGSIAGRVLGPDGVGIEAVVAADIGNRYEESKLGEMTGRRVLSSLPVHTRSGPDGGFRFDGVQPGRVELAVHSPLHPKETAELEVVPGRTAEVEIHLSTGATVSGRVLSAEGEPVPGALVIAPLCARNERPYSTGERWQEQDWLDWPLVFREKYATLRTRSDGSYSFRGLPSGWIFVAADAGERGRVFEPLTVAGDRERRVELTVTRGLELRLRFVDGVGLPLASFSVHVALVGAEGSSGSRGPWRTDAEGRLAVPNCRDGLYRIDLRDPRYGKSITGIRPQRPGPDELLIQIPFEDRAPAFVSGLVLDERGTPLEEARIEGRRASGSVKLAHSGPYGVLSSEEIFPDRYHLSVDCPAFPRLELGERVLASGETLDLGVLRMKTPGFLEVAITREDGGPVDERVDVALLGLDGGRWPAGPAVSFEIELGRARSGPIEPGAYLLRVEGAGVLQGEGNSRAQTPVRIEAGATTEAAVHLRIGAWRSLRFLTHASAPPLDLLHVRVRDAAGALLVDEELAAVGLDYFAGRTFDPGAYTVEAETPGGLRAAGSFRVENRSSSDETLCFELR